jgi:hypothetical protein
MDLSVTEGQEALAAELVQILEQLSGLDVRTLEDMDVTTLGYLLNLRCEGENKLVMAEVLRLQAALAGNGSGSGTPERWNTLAHQLEAQAQHVIVSSTTAELIKRFQDKRKQ